MISVVGGCYAEMCAMPPWNYVYGSAGRAAAVLSSKIAVELYTLLSQQFQKDFLTTLQMNDITHQFVSQSCSISFEYLHPLSSPTMFIDGEFPEAGTLKHVRSKNVLYFGMIEYVPVVHGNRVVYDPQSADPKFFTASGSTAKELIYVLNEGELRKITGIEDIDEAGPFLIEKESALAVVVKRGPLGATIFSGDGCRTVPCYRARRVFKIGSGDVFAAAFAYYWMIDGESIEASADLASRVVACYVETRDPYIPDKEQLLKDYNQPCSNRPGSVYLAAPFFSVEQRWLLEETKSLLEHLGCDVFSPLHKVGTGKTSDVLASEDLAGLKECNAILALMNDNDTGTVFEIGFGKALNKKIVVYAEKNSSRDLTMLEGTGCFVLPDFCSAIYSAVWESDVS